MSSECPAVVLANIQMHAVVPFIVGARRLRLPLVGHVASWDHTVGKGIVSPHLRRYIVQNGVMRSDLVRYHGIEADRIAVTGWPQTDVFHRRRPREEYDSILRRLGVDPARPVVLVMGNTPTNAPFEGRFVERLVHWWEESGADSRFSLLFRPHPRDREWRDRFAAALSRREWACKSRASPTSRGSPRCCSMATLSCRTRARSCSTRWSTTDRRSASSTTRARPRARAGR